MSADSALKGPPAGFPEGSRLPDGIAVALAAAREYLFRRVELDAELARGRLALLVTCTPGMGHAAVQYWCDDHRTRSLAFFDLQWGRG